MSKRAVVTGIGLVTPLGNDPRAFFQASLHGRSGIGQIQKFSTAGYAVQIGAEVAEPSPADPAAVDVPALARWAVHAAKQAVQDAALNLSQEDPFGIGVVMGVAAPGFDLLAEQFLDFKQKGPEAGRPYAPAEANQAAAAIHISRALGLKGEVLNIATSCSSSTQAIAYALRLIREGDAPCVLAGGTEEGVSPFFLSCFGNGKILSRRNDDPSHASRPYDRQRDGYVLADAACVLVVEEYERACARGVRPYCELTGAGAAGDACSPKRVGHSEESGARAIEQALRRAERLPEDVDYYCAHGSSSPWTDIRETRMLKRAFREHARRLAISSIKSMMGHPLGAAGAVQSATAALAIREKAVPPTINLEEPDKECDLDYVPKEARSMPIRNAVVYSLGMGGTNAALVLSAV
jgi:3-oxoacyl-[acyl-carrier-protein] synthase II